MAQMQKAFRAISLVTYLTLSPGIGFADQSKISEAESELADCFLQSSLEETTVAARASYKTYQTDMAGSLRKTIANNVWQASIKHCDSWRRDLETELSAEYLDKHMRDIFLDGFTASARAWTDYYVGLVMDLYAKANGQ